MFEIFVDFVDYFRMPRPEADANADWMRMRFSCSLDKHGNCEVEL